MTASPGGHDEGMPPSPPGVTAPSGAPHHRPPAGAGWNPLDDIAWSMAPDDAPSTPALVPVVERPAKPAPKPPPGFNLGFLEDQWDDDQASRHIGVEIQLLELDHAVFSLKITEHLVNGHGIVHGGYIFTLADTTFAYACNSRGLTTVAAGVDITFVQAAYLGDVLVADARVRANWGRSGITDVTVTRESDGALVAEFRGRSRQIPPKATPTSLA